MMLWISWIGGLLLAGYLLLMVMSYVYQERMLFLAPPLADSASAQFQKHATEYPLEGATLRGWFLAADDPLAPLVVYYGGNAEEGSWNIPHLKQLGVSILLINYRGYGASDGSPSEAALKEDALKLLDHWTQLKNIPLTQVVLMGRSLGSGVATYVASQRAVAGVILVTPYDSLVAVGQHHYPWFPVSLLMRNRFESVQLAPQLQMPMLSLVGGKDKVVPPARAHALQQAWAGPSETKLFANADHINLTDDPTYWPSIHQFIDRLR